MNQPTLNHVLLSKVSIFADLEESALRAIASHAVVKTFPKHTILIYEGERTDSLFVILSGKIKIYASDMDGREVALNFLGPNECFGELAVIDAEPRTASAVTLETSKLGIILRDDFLRYLHQAPSIAISMLKTLVCKLRRETESVKSLALMDVYGRVAKLLLRNGSGTGGPFDNRTSDLPGDSRSNRCLPRDGRTNF